MVTQGIARNRLVPIGLGESEPRNECNDGVPCTEQEHARNRRTEVRMLTGLTGSSMVYIDGNISNSSNYEDDKKPNKVNEKPQQYSGGGKVKVTNAANDSYYVVAGSFLIETRANNQLAFLREQGHENAEIVRFPNSNFYSVCVGRFKTRDEAAALKRQLESDNIDAFVRAVQ
jgi:cell division protein FtsN